MTKSAPSAHTATATPVREPRPFLFLEPTTPGTQAPVIATATQQRLERIATNDTPQLVRSVVDYTIALQNRRALERGNPQPIQLSVLNRRRRAARSWLLAILAGRTDATTLQTVTTQWLPVLCAVGAVPTGMERSGRRLIEFVRGALAACLFETPADNLLPHAKALHVVESTLAAHLAALLRSATTTTNTTAKTSTTTTAAATTTIRTAKTPRGTPRS